MEMEYRPIREEELCRALFEKFQRRQVVDKCWRKVDGQWCIRADPFIDDWNEEDYEFLVRCLKNTVATGGVVLGGFLGGTLKGFASVESEPMGSGGVYRDLTSLHVSSELRGQGVGKSLFTKAAEWARAQGGKKLYISGHSAVETQAFYQAMGCREAEEYMQKHAEAEPFDCQLEYVIP